MEHTDRGRTSDTACFASSPGRMSRTDVWISRLVTVGFLLYRASAYAQWDVNQPSHGKLYDAIEAGRV